MENLKHTKGEWDYSFPEHNEKQIYIHAGSELPLAKITYNYNEAIANAKLIADAGTTTNKCGLLPSELLEQRDELLEACIKASEIIKSDYLLNAIKKATT